MNCLVLFGTLVGIVGLISIFTGFSFIPAGWRGQTREIEGNPARLVGVVFLFVGIILIVIGAS